jgi:glycosyltransferase 2 family protein
VQHAEQTTSPSSVRRNWLGWGLAILILTVLAFTLDLEDVLATLARVTPLELGAILLLMTVDRLIMAWKWSMLLRAIGVELPLMTITRFYYQGTLSGTFLPSQVGGDVLRGYWVSEATGTTHPVVASLVMEKVIGILAAASWGVVGGVVLAYLAYPAELWIWVLLGAGAIVLGYGAFVLSMQPVVHGIVLRGLRPGRKSRILGLLHRLYEAYAQFSYTPRALAANLLISVVEQALQIGVLLLVAQSLNLNLEAGATAFLAAAALHLMIFRIPILPDNWGVGELTAIGIFGLIGIKPQAAFSLMLFCHILQVIVVLPGLLFLLRSPERSTIPSSPRRAAGCRGLRKRWQLP